MKAWRCTNHGCKHICTDDQVSDVGKVKSCPVCGSMVVDATNTRVGAEFLAKQTRRTPSSISNQYLNRVLSIFPE